MTALSALADVAARQHHVITTAQLRSLGFSRAAVRHLVATERLFRLHRGVYAVARRDVTREGRWMAAVLGAPAHGALGRLSAAVSWELLEHEDRYPQVVVPATSSNRGAPGIRVHRCSDLTAGDVVPHRSIPTTTVLRTLVDLSRGGVGDRALARAVRQAGRLHRADLQQLAGLPRLSRIVSLYDPRIGMTDSDLEVLFLGLCAQHRLPAPLPQHRFGRFLADFTWHEFRLVVECDSRGWHFNHVNYLTDRQKDRLIRSAGYEVLRFTYAEIVHHPAAVAKEIRAAMGRQAQKRSR